jgi:anti-sigma-K factor RskA
VTDFDHEFEKELRQGLVLRNAPDGFADKVLSRIPEHKQMQPIRWPVWRWATAAVVVLAVLLGVRFEWERQQKIAGEHAREQVLLALRITSTTLQAVNLKIREDRSTKDVQP